MTILEQHKKKIELEERFRREVRVLFGRMRKEFRLGISTGNQKWIMSYKPAWETALEKHYQRVQKAFKGAVLPATKQTEQEKDDEVLAALLLWADGSKTQHAQQILNTSQQNMNSALAQAMSSMTEDGVGQYTSRELSLVAAAILGRKFMGRESIICISETQAAAESTKLIEAYSVADLKPVDAVVSQPAQKPVVAKKKWQDVGDKKVRNGHRASQVAVVPIDKPFIVNGQMMRYPGDNSMGASADNIAGCRCGTQYTF